MNCKQRLQKKKKETILEEKLQVEQNEKLMQVNQDIKFTKDSIQPVEQVIIDANEQVAEVLKSANICKSSVQKVHSLMQMSLDRKRTLESSLSDLETKRKKL